MLNNGSGNGHDKHGQHGQHANGAARTALVTGGAGFIGSHLVDRLADEGWEVTIIDNFNAYYDPFIKWANIARHQSNPRIRLVKTDVRTLSELETCLTEEYDLIVHLAARPGVRPSMDDPEGYYDVNVGGTRTMLEFARRRGIRQFVYASSSSVYGLNPNVPWREQDTVLIPASPYAQTKVRGEELGRHYSESYGIRFIALRFFSVYGPRQRPDLAFSKFARAIRAGEPIPVYGDGSSRRDYTYVADVVEGIKAAMNYTEADYDVFNLGNNYTLSLREMIEALEAVLEMNAERLRLPEQPGDVPQTWADISHAERLLNYRPTTSLHAGLVKFHEWLLATEDVPMLAGR